MKYLIVIVASFLCISGCIKVKSNNPLDKVSASADEPQKALAYLNRIRATPSSFSSELGVDLSYVNSAQNLVWNDTLAKVANAKAMDMATRNYFAHVDPDGNGINIKINDAGYLLIPAFLTTKNQNNFESLAAGSQSGIDAIKNLIIDKGINPPGHRIHLLAIDSFWANCYDVGIGFVKGNSGTSYISYCCVIIAKHNF